MVTGCFGGSNVWSCKPAATNTIALSNLPFGLTTTSWFKTGVGCCFAQVGSAAMLMGLAFGAVPSNLTVPLTVPPFFVAPLAAGPAFTTRRLLTPMIPVKAIREKSRIVVIQTDFPPQRLGHDCRIFWKFWYR